MTTYFDFGPAKNIELEFTGDAAKYYNCYEYLPIDVQEALQLLCHAIIQVLPIATNNEMGKLWIDDTFFILNINNSKYCISNFKTGMAVMNLTKESSNKYTTDFFSTKQMALTDPIISYAYNDALINGRRF